MISKLFVKMGRWAYGSALYLPPVISVKKCILVWLLGSAKRDLNLGAVGAT